MTYRSVSRIYLFLASLVFIVALASHDSAASSPIEQRFNAFYRVQSSMPYSSTKDIAVLINKSYKPFSREQTPHKLRATSNKDLKFLYRAANMATYYTYDSGYIRDMEFDIDELERRGLASQAEYDDMYTTFVAARMFREAQILAAKHPSSAMSFLPRFRDQSRGGPTELVLSPDMRYLIRRSVDMSEPAQVIIVSSPWCHFCQRAVRDIESDPALRQVVRYHALWLELPDGSIPFSAVHRWNEQHPHEIMALAYKIQEWPMFDHWDTPTFYFFKKGTLIIKLTGWPREGQKEKFRKALRRVNLL